MRIGILQPGYLPWLGFFEQIHRSDLFVIYDDVLYTKNDWRNRNKIKASTGPVWLTVPIIYRFSEKKTIREIRIDNNSNWREKHFSTISQNYSNAPFYKDYICFFEDAFQMKWEFLIDLNMHFLVFFNSILGIKNKDIIMSSSLNITGGKQERLIKICRHFSADVLYEGQAGKNYIDIDLFLRHGINVEFQEYFHPVYKQLYGEFIPYLSIVDLIFNVGDESLKTLSISDSNKEDFSD